MGDRLKDLRTRFSNPDPEYSVIPFWFWNDKLDQNELLRQVELMKKAGVQAFFIHAREGLQTPYLSELWFQACETVIEAAARLGMFVWIYDEYNWPSGYAGGRVLKKSETFVGWNLMPDHYFVEGPCHFDIKLDECSLIRGVNALHIAEVHPKQLSPLDWAPGIQKVDQGEALWSDTVAYEHIFATQTPIDLRNCLIDGKLQWNAPKGRWRIDVFRQRRTDWTAPYSSDIYIDLMNAEAVDTFIRETHEQYWSRFKKYFGNTIRGFFMDESGLYNNFLGINVHSIAWTHDFVEQFKQRKKYDITMQISELYELLSLRSFQTRFDYYEVVSNLLHERFFNKVSAWCKKHSVSLTGHLVCEEWLYTMVRNSGNPFTVLQSLEIPGVDKIDEAMDKTTEKVIASISHINGKARVLSEIYACIGWKLAPPYMKRIADHQYVSGINLLAPHAFFYSVRDFRLRETPPSEFFQNPWWEHSKPLWRYL